MIKKVLVGGLCFLFAFCKQKPILEEETPFEVSDQVITLREGSHVKTRIKTTVVSQEEFSFHLVTAGVVTTIPNNYAEIAPPFAGRIQKSFVRVGQKVQVGTPLFEISSPDYFEAQKDYFEAKQEFKQSELNLKRQRDLLRNGVGVQQEVEEAETEFITKKATMTQAGAALKIFSIDPDQVVLGQPLIVRAPIAGEVVSNMIVLGQYIKEDAEPIAIIAALEKVWIVAKVKEKDIKHLSKLHQVHIELSAYPDQSIVGTIYHINEIVDEETRSVEVMIEVENQDRKLKPGMYVNVNFMDKPEEVIFIPTKALMQDEDSSFVYVKVAEDKYRRQDVVSAGSSGERTIIIEGLTTDAEVISEGGIYLLQAK
ncbi:efflux RND transporter periplasmic adaptor subunit [Flavobacterium sp. NKUCC04_CG]|uniref:efflux RND transporter periplasmic adaptor subunit n=1 Tax=Flavobacterium sp. NKUCC04_CG TaxID=2842121 RepID=UPI001C5BD0F1|nr:efflux RND transporter periplasmic adaptor subunit [Flavobacterium sp. NKUCC04_CG]MBW3518340.1 efflux RND transporter periplasmic adaptor subunit [Flavobacterium sp. NKUCC04_CG]